VVGADRAPARDRTAARLSGR